MSTEMSTEMNTALHLHLKAPHEPLEGEPLKTIEGLSGALTLKEGGLTVELSSEAGSVSEVRWLISRALDALKGTFTLGAVSLQASEALEAPLVRAVALDLLSRFKQVSLPQDERLEGLGALAELEAGYRAWVNEDPSTRTSLKIAEDVLAYAEAHEGIEAHVLTEDELRAHNMNLLLAVGGASQISPPRLVVATYGDPSSDAPPLMIVGKGVTFDSGGINVKPYESFVSMMKNDMGGAAMAWHLFKGLVERDFPEPLVVVIPTCENPVGEGAMRPGSVVTGHRGVSVRIDHTDAEGRLILADALSWASERFTPREVICFATLTTAALNSYGPFATPVHFARPELQSALEGASEEAGQDLHFFPYRAWHHEANRDHEAQLRNTARLPGNASKGAGSRNAAHFLRYFTDAHLTHLDIFASTWDWSGQSPQGTRHGATGAPLRALLTGLERYAHERL